MQNTSATYKSILNGGYYETEVKVLIQNTGGTMTEYTERNLTEVSVSWSAFGDTNLTIGSACLGSCRIGLISDDYSGKELSRTIPRGTRMEIYERIYNGSQTSEWLPQGVFFVDARDDTTWTGRLMLDGVDAMVFADALYPETEDGWPAQGKTDAAVVSVIARKMGVSVDSGTQLGNAYPIPFPGTYTMREVLRYIGAMYCGNWIITKEGKLLLLKLDALPPETNYLINNAGENITIGDGNNRIILRPGGVYIEYA